MPATLPYPLQLLEHLRRHFALSLAILTALLLTLTVLLFGVNTWQLDMTLNGEAEQVLEYGTEYQEEGATARFHGTKFCKDGWDVQVLRTGFVDPGKVGRYNLVYWGQKLGWTTTLRRTIVIQDTVAPVITLIQDPEHYTLPNHPYEEEGYVAVDNYDGDITDRVKVKEKNGVVTYSVSDSSGNKTSVRRVIVYDDPIAPKLKLKGKKKLTITMGTPYTEPGWSAVDSADGDLSDKVKVKGAVDVATPGTYTLKYSVKDAAGNKATAKRVVTVEPGEGVPDKKVVYLTFDDGPGQYTAELLDVLAKYNVKATFFTCNTNYPEMMAREAAEGHTVAIHSYTHEYSQIYKSEEAFFKDLYKQQDLIYQQTGVRPKLLRFPGGSSNSVSRKYCEGIMTELTQDVVNEGFQYFDWNVLSGDAGETTDTDEVVKNVINGLKEHEDGYSVVLQHDIHGFSVKAVERIIVWGQEHGYTFLPLNSTSPGAHHGLNN